MAKKLLFLALALILLGACSRQNIQGTKSIKGTNENQNTKTEQTKCQKLKKEIEDDLAKINYCQQDDDCVLVDRVYCPFGCYFAHNQKKDFSPVERKMKEYSSLCGVCRFKCPPYAGKNLKCLDGECVRPRK